MEPDIDNFADILFDNYDIEEDQPISSTNEPENTEIKQEGTKKIPKKKLNEDLLLDGKGLTLLKSETRHLKFNGKGHEDQDLKKLITYYTVWANNLFPKLKFQDFAQRIGKPASSKRVKEVMDVWKDEFIERRNIKLGIHQQESADEQQPEDNQDDESSEDDNRPLFFPINNETTLKKKSKPKPKQPSQKTTQASNMDKEDDLEDEEPLFNQGTKRKLVIEADEEEEPSLTREGALARLAKKRQERDIAKRAEELKRKEKELEQTKIELEKADDTMMDEYADAAVDLALSDGELELLNIQK